MCLSLFFNKVAGTLFIKKEILAQVFSCEFCEISKNAFGQNTSGGCFRMDWMNQVIRVVDKSEMFRTKVRIKF